MPKTPAPMLVPKMMPMVSRRLIGRARRPESVWAEPGRAGVFMGSPNADKDSRWGGADRAGWYRWGPGRLGPGGSVGAPAKVLAGPGRRPGPSGPPRDAPGVHP